MNITQSKIAQGQRQEAKIKEDQIREKKIQSFNARRTLLEKIPNPGYNSAQHPKLQAKFNGYMGLLKKKMERQGIFELKQYYSSSYFSDLKEKRNISFNQDILEKMYKQYSLEEYQSNISKNIFDPTAPAQEDQYYEGLDRRAGEKLRK